MLKLGKAVGWYCLKCEDVLPKENRLCHCLDATEKADLIRQHRAKHWFPLYVGRG